MPEDDDTAELDVDTWLSGDDPPPEPWEPETDPAEHDDD